MSDLNSAGFAGEEEGARIRPPQMEMERAPLSTPPPIPPKPRKFSRISTTRPQPVGQVTSSRPPMAPPPPPTLTLTDLGAMGIVHKRKLTLPISIPLSISSTSLSPALASTSLRCAGDSEGKRSEAETVCKSPKLMTPGQSRIWSPVICTICMEDLFSHPEPESDVHSRKFSFETPDSSMNMNGSSRNAPRINPGPDDIRPIVSTRCGHLFHTECINRWFRENKEKELKECPFCKREMMANDTIRIFPIFDDH